MSGSAKWARRVAEWRGSGLSSVEFCKGKPFTAGGLRYWAYRLRQEAGLREAQKPSVRIGRVLVRPAPVGAPPEPAHLAAAPPMTTQAEKLLVECGVMRVVVRPGFDREALATVLDVLASKGGRW